MVLRDPPYKGAATYDTALSIARDAKGADTEGYRAEFIHLVDVACGLGKR